ncbi:GFA family protein [Vibrio porteresiae]|uniref:GFA family protein n=1 Tax=Vibrio porteresiae DSM 19223 TaxID=1123496 RepID=A0ABZ0QBR8_9VIBR|nr:GFA family protein [Vibrio porteresiae]WPC73025.1 GFA family protein [Vibrio porteresiae DSM 19223]
MSKLIHGSCYCQKIMFIVKDEFSRFYFCHCDQCRKMMGTAHAANLFTEVDNLTWLKGAELVKRYDDPHRAFTKAFCPECGSPLPYLSKASNNMVVPAGCLDEEPSKQVDAQLFCVEQPHWYQVGLSAEKKAGFPNS